MFLGISLISLVGFVFGLTIIPDRIKFIRITIGQKKALELFPFMINIILNICIIAWIIASTILLWKTGPMIGFWV